MGLLRYILRRILLTVPTLLVVIFVTFTLGFYDPGDPVRVMFGVERNVSEDVPRRARARFGLDQPDPIQLANFATKLARGDFGHSIILNRDVKDVIAFALPVSAQVGLAAMALMVSIGVPLGILAAVKQHTTIDYAINRVQMRARDVAQSSSPLNIPLAAVGAVRGTPRAGKPR